MATLEKVKADLQKQIQIIKKCLQYLQRKRDDILDLQVEKGFQDLGQRLKSYRSFSGLEDLLEGVDLTANSQKLKEIIQNNFIEAQNIVDTSEIYFFPKITDVINQKINNTLKINTDFKKPFRLLNEIYFPLQNNNYELFDSERKVYSNDFQHEQVALKLQSEGEEESYLLSLLSQVQNARSLYLIMNQQTKNRKKTQRNMSLHRSQTKQQEKQVSPRVKCNFKSLYLMGSIEQACYCISMMIMSNLEVLTLDLSKQFEITQDFWDYRYDPSNNPYLSKKFFSIISKLTCRTVQMTLPGFKAIESSEATFVESSKTNRPQVKPNTIYFFNSFFSSLSKTVKQVKITVQTQENLSMKRIEAMLEKTNFRKFIEKAHPQEVLIFGFKFT